MLAGILLRSFPVMQRNLLFCSIVFKFLSCKYSVLPSTRYEPIRVCLQDVEVLVIYGIKIYV